MTNGSHYVLDDKRFGCSKMRHPIYAEIKGEISHVSSVKSERITEEHKVPLLLFAPMEWCQKIFPFHNSETVEVTFWLLDGPHSYTFFKPYVMEADSAMTGKIRLMLEHKVLELEKSIGLEGV